MTVVERDYPNTYRKFTALGPLMTKVGNGGKGIGWNTEHEVKQLGQLNYTVTEPGISLGPAAHRDRHRRGRNHPDARARDQRRSGGEGLGGAVEGHRPRTCPSRAPQGGREAALSRPAGAAAQDHLQPDLERHRVRARLVQRRLDQRPRADSLAHAHRPPAALPGPQVDAGLRRGAGDLPPAGRPEDHRTGEGHEGQRPHGDRPQFHHAAPEVGHPLHLHRQPDDADAEPRRPDRSGCRRPTPRRPASSTTTGSSSTT